MKVTVVDFGAKPNNDTVQTQEFQRAIDYCFAAGGGEVVVPAGEYIIGDIRLRSNITLHLMENAKLLGSCNPEDYVNIYNDKVEPLPVEQATRARWYTVDEWTKMGGGFKKHLYTAGSYWNYGIIRAVYAENVTIIGEKGSEIVGQNAYDPDGEENYRGPHSINMHFCKNIRFVGYTVVDSANWSHAIFHSQDIVFDEITVLGGHDALHTRACDNVVIKNCKLITGDDCIAGFNNNNVTISNCKISSACSAFRYGGNNILIEDCNIYGPCQYQFRGRFTQEEKMSRAKTSKVARNNMLSFYTNFVSDDLPVRIQPGNIVIRNCTVKGADRFLHLNLSGNEPWQNGNPPTDITFENVKAEDIGTGLYAYGSENSLFDLTLKNIEYRVREGYEKEPFIKAAHFGNIMLENVQIDNYSADDFIKTWSDGGTIKISNLKANIKEDIRTIAKEPFECNPI